MRYVDFDPFEGEAAPPVKGRRFVDFDPFAEEEKGEAVPAKEEETPSTWEQVKSLPWIMARGASLGAGKRPATVARAVLEAGDAEREEEEIRRQGREPSVLEQQQLATRKQFLETERKPAIEALKTWESAYPEALPKDLKKPGILQEAAAGVSESLPLIALGVLTGGAAVPYITPGFFTQIMGQSYEEYTKEGVDPHRALESAFFNALAQTPLESAGAVFEIGALGKIGAAIAGKSGASIVRRVGSFIYNLLKTGGAEGGEELLQQVPDEMAKVYAANPDMNVVDVAKWAWENRDKIKEKAFYAAKIGAVGGLLMGGLGAAAQAPFALADYQIRKKSEKLTEEEREERLRAEGEREITLRGILDQAIQSGDITEGDILGMKRAFADDPIIQRVAGDYLSQLRKPKPDEPIDLVDLVEAGKGRKQAIPTGELPIDLTDVRLRMPVPSGKSAEESAAVFAAQPRPAEESALAFEEQEADILGQIPQMFMTSYGDPGLMEAVARDLADKYGIDRAKVDQVIAHGMDLRRIREEKEAQYAGEIRRDQGQPIRGAEGGLEEAQPTQGAFQPTEEETLRPGAGVGGENIQLQPEAGGAAVEQPGLEEVKEIIDTAAKQAATAPESITPEPTEAQKKAGNYKKGHFQWNGLDLSIENPQGSTREGVSREGKKWKTTLAHHYGYIRRTEGKDGDQVDIFMGDNPLSDRVFVVNQVNPKTGEFDEHKVMLGFGSEQAAWDGYMANYDRGWKGLGSMATMTLDEFRGWLKEGDKTQPVGFLPERKAKGKKGAKALKEAVPVEEAMSIWDELAAEEGAAPQVEKDLMAGLMEARAIIMGVAEAAAKYKGEEVVGVKYQLIKPILDTTYKRFLKEGKSLREFTAAAIKTLGREGRPYFQKFYQEEIQKPEAVPPGPARKEAAKAEAVLPEGFQKGQKVLYSINPKGPMGTPGTIYGPDEKTPGNVVVRKKEDRRLYSIAPDRIMAVETEQPETKPTTGGHIVAEGTKPSARGNMVIQAKDGRTFETDDTFHATAAERVGVALDDIVRRGIVDKDGQIQWLDVSPDARATILLEHPTNDLEEILNLAKQAKDELTKWTTFYARKFGGWGVYRPGWFEGPDKGIKSRKRIEEKKLDYVDPKTGEVKYSQISDVIASSIIFENQTTEQMMACLAALKKDPKVIKIKNRYDAPLESGYRDILIKIRMSNGLIAELQLNLERVWWAKEFGPGHALYEIDRTAQAIYKDEKESPEDRAEARRIYDLTVAGEKQLYDAAFEAKDLSSAISMASSREITEELQTIWAALEGSSTGTRFDPSNLKRVLDESSLTSTKGRVPSYSKNTSLRAILFNPPSTQKIAPKGGKVNKILGDTQKLVTGKETHPVTFALVEQSTLIPSHKPLSFAKNPDYPEGVQERTYHSDRKEQLKVIDHEVNMKTNLLINNNPDAINGPPIITPDGIVLGGNSRAMSIMRAYERNTKGPKYKAKLAQFAGQFGLTAEQVNGMKEPVLVRIYTPDKSDKDTLHRLATAFNKPPTEAMGAEAKTASMGRNVTPETLTTIGGMLMERDMTLRELLDEKEGMTILQRLVRDGVIADTEVNALTTAGSLNRSGKDLIENTILGSVIPDADTISTAPRIYLMKIEKSLTSWAIIKGRGDEWDITPQLNQAIQILTKMKAKGIRMVDEYVAQIPMFGTETIPGDVVAIAKSLKDTSPKQWADALKGYAADAKADVKGQTTFFPIKSQPESFREWFKGEMPKPQTYEERMDAAAEEINRILAAEGAGGYGAKAPFYVDQEGMIIVVGRGTTGQNWTWYRKKSVKETGNRIRSRGHGTVTETANFYPTREEAAAALADYARGKGWTPVARFQDLDAITRERRGPEKEAWTEKAIRERMAALMNYAKGVEEAALPYTPTTGVDEAKYQAISKILRGIWTEAQARGDTLPQFIKTVFGKIGIQGRPYLERFMGEVAEAEKAAKAAPKEEKPARDLHFRKGENIRWRDWKNNEVRWGEVLYEHRADDTGNVVVKGNKRDVQSVPLDRVWHESEEYPGKKHPEVELKPTTEAAPVEAKKAPEATPRLRDFTVNVPAIVEATGEKTEIEENAEMALNELNGKLETYHKLMECLDA